MSWVVLAICFAVFVVAFAAMVRTWTYGPDQDSRIRADFAVMLKVGGLLAANKYNPKARIPRSAIDAMISFFSRDAAGSEVTTRNLVVGAEGRAIPIRAYAPRAAGPGELPVVLFFHGGAWITGSIATHDNLCKRLARATDALVMSVDYRLAPEHKYPAGVEDAYAALLWVAAGGNGDVAKLGGDPERLGVAGDSAGGNLAAVVARRAMTRGGPRIRHQGMFYPLLNVATFNSASHGLLGRGGWGIRSLDLEIVRQTYLKTGDDPHDPDVSPVMATDFAGMPPATVVTAQFDVLRDEGEEYAAKLAAAGVAATATRYSGMIHGFASMHRWAPRESQRAIAEVAAGLKRDLAK